METSLDTRGRDCNLNLDVRASGAFWVLSFRILGLVYCLGFSIGLCWQTPYPFKGNSDDKKHAKNRLKMNMK